MYFNPPHEVRDTEKLESLVSSILAGDKIKPIVVYGDQAYTGSHRIAAFKKTDEEIDFVVMSKREWVLSVALMNGVDIDPEEATDEDVEEIEKIIIDNQWEVSDYNVFCEALLRVTEDEEIKKAVMDQI